MNKKIRITWVLAIAEVILILIALASFFGKEELVLSTSGAELSVAAEQKAGSMVLTTENLTLSPGVYQVRAAFQIPEKASVFLLPEGEEGSFKALRCNGVTVFPGQEYADFEIYVMDKVNPAWIRCEFSGTGESALTGLSLYRTNIGGRLVSLLLLAVCALAHFLILLRGKILSGRLDRAHQTAFWALLFCVAVAYLPYATDYFHLGADTAFHLSRIEGLKETLQQGGQFPIRVQSFFLYEHGYACSTFYGDLFLLVPAFLRIAGFSLMTSYKLFVLLVMSATAFVSFYSFKKCSGDIWGALFGSLLYVLAPYWLYNFYNRGAVGEYLAMIFLPMICCGMALLYRQDVHSREYSRAKLWIVAGLTGVLQSHILSLEMTAALIAFVCLLLWKKTFRKETFLQLAQAAGLALLLNCWFWLPLLQSMAQERLVLHELVNYSIQEKGTWFAGLLQLVPHMGGSQTGMYNSEPIQIGAASLLMLAVSGGLAYEKWRLIPKEKRSGGPYRSVLLFLAGMIVLLMIMSTRYFPWNFLERIPGLKMLVTALQFPTRLLSPATVLCAMFAAYFVPWLRMECVGVRSCLSDGKRSNLPDEEQSNLLDGKQSNLSDGKQSNLSDGKQSSQPDGKRSNLPEGKRSSQPDGKQSNLPDGKQSSQPDGKQSNLPDGKRSNLPDGNQVRMRGLIFYKGVILILAAVAVFSAMFHVNDIAFEREAVYLYTAENMGTIAVGNGEYLLGGTKVAQYHYHGPEAGNGLEWSNYHKNGLNISIRISNKARQEEYLELPVTGYKGYRLETDGGQGEAPYIAEERGAHGDLRIAVPPGFDGMVRVWYGGLWSFRIAELVSLFTVLGLLGYAVTHRTRRTDAVRVRKEALEARKEPSGFRRET